MHDAKVYLYERSGISISRNRTKENSNPRSRGEGRKVSQKRGRKETSSGGKKSVVTSSKTSDQRTEEKCGGVAQQGQKNFRLGSGEN